MTAEDLAKLSLLAIWLCALGFMAFNTGKDHWF